MKFAGVYKITNTKTDHCYVGSSKDIDFRLYTHKNLLGRKIHFNSHLQSSYNKHGRENFMFEILEICSLDALVEREQYWLDTLKPAYNIRKKAESNLGIKWSKESREKRSKEKSKGPIYEYNLLGEFITEWKSALEASIGRGYTYSSVNFCLNNKFRKCKQSIFRFQKFNKIEPYKFFHKKRKERKVDIIKKDKEGNVICIYEDTKKCADDLGFSKIKIQSMIFNKSFHRREYTLEYGKNTNN